MKSEAGKVKNENGLKSDGLTKGEIGLGMKNEVKRERMKQDPNIKSEPDVGGSVRGMFYLKDRSH